MFRAAAAVAISFLLSASALQAQGQRDPRALALAQLSLRALLGNTTLSDATLQGTGSLIAGGDQESGTFALELKGNQESKLVLNLSGGTRQEIRQNQAGAWIGPDGEKRQMALHNCWTDASVMLPAFSLGALLNNPQISAIYLGQVVTSSGVTADHIQLSYVVSGQSQQMTAEIQGLSAIDVYLDAASHLPVELDFNTHAESDMGLNIPVSIQFSVYQRLRGIQVATRIEKLLQGTLTLDMTVSGVAVNTGISDGEFNTQ